MFFGGNMSQFVEKQNIDFEINKVIGRISKQFLEYNNAFDCSNRIVNKNGKLEICYNSEDAVLNNMLQHILIFLQSELQKNNGNLYSTEYLDTDLIIQNINSKLDNWIVESCYKGLTIQDINELSNLSYESANCAGSIMLVNDKQNISCDVSFYENEYNTSFEFSGKNLKFIRKLLEVTDDKLYLVLKHIHGKTWIPIGFSTECETHSYPILSIKGKLHWEFLASHKKVLFSQGKYVICGDKDNLLENELNKFKQVNDRIDLHSLKKLIGIIKDSKDIHGALFIFLDDFHKEKVDDLCKHKYGIKVNNIDDNIITLGTPSKGIEIISSLCKIDGALVFDKSGKLLSVSTILDGCVVNDGDIGRGSRFNSTKTFVEYYTTFKGHDNLKCYGLVISEDGYVNFIQP